MKFASSQDDYHNWIDKEEGDEAKEVQAISFYPRKEPIEPLEWKIPENRLKPSVDKPPKVELKALPGHLEYAFLQGDDKILVVISSSLSALQKDVGIIYPISDSPWVSPVQVVPKKGGMRIVRNEKNELIPQCTVIGWRVCIDYRKRNDATRKIIFLFHSLIKCSNDSPA
ncbi:hypothetical protein Tco_0043039 [Tanacetum coccineum]